MFRRNLRRLAQDPFSVLQLNRTASKQQVKEKYRSLAKQYHPDQQTTGDSKKMEELNRAYNLLLKEGMYESLHSKLQEGAEVSGVQAPSSSPSSSTSSPASNATSKSRRSYYEKMARLDPETERVTPDGEFTYQNKDTGEWTRLNKPLTRVKQPRYNSYDQQRKDTDLFNDIKKKQMEAEKEALDKTWWDRQKDKYKANFPSDKPVIIFMVIVAYIAAGYYAWARSIVYWTKADGKRSYYEDLRGRKNCVGEIYPYFKDEMHLMAEIATCAYIAAALEKSEEFDEDDPIDDVAVNKKWAKDPFVAHKPPGEHFQIHAGV